MVHKLRKAMGEREDRYTLQGMVEADEGYFTIQASSQEHQNQKAGRAKRNVMVMAESTPLESLENKTKSSQCFF